MQPLPLRLLADLRDAAASTDDLTKLCSALERLKLTSCSLYEPLLVKIEEELDEDDDDTAFASG